MPNGWAAVVAERTVAIKTFKQKIGFSPVKVHPTPGTDRRDKDHICTAEFQIKWNRSWRTRTAFSKDTKLMKATMRIADDLPG